MSKKIIDIANSLEFVKDYNQSGITGNNARISTSENGELFLYAGSNSLNSTTGTIVLYNGGLSINSTYNSTSYTSGGTLTVKGGASIFEDVYLGSNLYVATRVSSATLNASEITVGNINFTGNLYQNGSLYVSSQWISDTASNLIYTAGNIGIGTTSPSNTLEVNGTIKTTNFLNTNSTINTLNAVGITAGNINFTGDLYRNGSLYVSSQWTSDTSNNLSYNLGLVGIGTQTPGSTLDINGNLNVSGSNSPSTISVSRASGDVIVIKNTSISSNSAVEFQSNSGVKKLSIGYANSSSYVSNFAGTSYILSEDATSIKMSAGNKTSVPIIINANDNSLSITTTTDATDKYSGALKVSGGVGIANTLYVGDDAHIMRDLYVYGAINGAAASSSTFSYMTLTATDDAINLSTGALVTYGGIVIQSTADAESITSGGTFLTEGGASIGKTLYVGQEIITDLISTSNLVSDNITAGNILSTHINFGVSSMYSGSFTPSNNTSTPSDVVGLIFDNANIRSFNITLSANIIASVNLYETFVLEGVQLGSEWDLYVSSFGDTTNITFSITSNGQVQYTMPDIGGFTNAIFRYQVLQMNNTGTYVYPGGGVTQNTLITNTIQILSTEDSNIGVNNGSLYLAGGCTISKTLCSSSISTGNLTVNNATFDSINIIDRLGIGTVFPAAPLHIIGTTDLTSSTVGGIFMGSAENTYSFIQLNSTVGSHIDFSVTGQDYNGRIVYEHSANHMDFHTNAVAVARLDSTGSLTVTGDFAAFTSISDKRLKTDIICINSDDSLDKVNKLNPVTFTWKDDIFHKSVRGDRDVGFIAQEVEEVIEYAVGEYTEVNSGERYKRIKYERIIPYLVSAIQKLDVENRKKSMDIEKLMYTVDILSERISNMESQYRQ